MKLKWSMFTFHVKNDKEVIIYNYLNHGVVSLERDIYDNIFDKKNEKVVKSLIKQEYLLDEKIDEKEKFMNALMDEWNNSQFLDLHILTTTGCNFKCPYCYQCGIKATALNEEKLDKEMTFLDKYIKDNNIHECRIEVTGGEPTTNWKIVEKMLPRLKKIFRENKVKFETLIVTNGYLLDKEKVDFISKYNWKRLQLTIDGLEEVHNKRRVYPGNGNSFKTIISNLDYIINNNKIKVVNIRINYDNSNINEVPKLLDFLHDRYGTEKIRISLGLITKTVDGTDANNFINKYGINDNEFIDAYIKLYKELMKRGFETYDLFAYDGMCTSKLKHGFLLQPDGKIIKCVSGVGREDFVIGNYMEDNISDTNYLFPELYEECLDKKCPFLPICHTGCRFDAYVKNKDVKKIICKRELLEKINSEIIKINYM